MLFRLILRLVDVAAHGSLNYRLSLYNRELRLLRRGYHTKYWYGPSMLLHRLLKAKFALALGFPLKYLEEQGGSLFTHMT